MRGIYSEKKKFNNWAGDDECTGTGGLWQEG